MSKGGRPRKFGETEKELLRQLVAKNSLATLSELTEAFFQQTGFSVHHMTVRRRLEEMGIQRERATPPSRQREPERRYGY